MKINFEPHTLVRMKEYGVSEIEVGETLQTGVEFPAKRGRKGRFKVFPFQKTVRGKFYSQIRLEVIYVEENEEIFTITIYAKYGSWEE